jgi:ribosomal protein S18 acetylase RimI-like enzyme
MELRFQRFDDAQLPELMRWFPDASSCSLWGGPHFRYPYTPSTFREDTGVERLPSWMLVSPQGGLVAFGQVYLRIGRCHLGHLAVAPERRGQGIGTRLIHELCAQGASDLGVEEFSLFVLSQNVVALALYERLGFRSTTYPAPVPGTTPMLYMVASGAAALGLRTAR